MVTDVFNRIVSFVSSFYFEQENWLSTIFFTALAIQSVLALVTQNQISTKAKVSVSIVVSPNSSKSTNVLVKNFNRWVRPRKVVALHLWVVLRSVYEIKGIGVRVRKQDSRMFFLAKLNRPIQRRWHTLTIVSVIKFLCKRAIERWRKENIQQGSWNACLKHVPQDCLPHVKSLFGRETMHLRWLSRGSELESINFMNTEW